MSTTQAGRPTDVAPSGRRSRRRDDLDGDLVAVLAMVAILVMTALAIIGRTALAL